jgi:choline dehydrogenase-like flavoprotein
VKTTGVEVSGCPSKEVFMTNQFLQFAKNKGSAKNTVKAKKEVILAAGAIHTPQILQVSGIGDSALLSSIDVPVVVDLPAVGQNFHDHVLLAVVGTGKSCAFVNTS